MENMEKRKLSAGEELFSWAQSLIWALIAMVLLSSFVVRISGVSGESMVPTLQDNDRVLVQVAGYTKPKWNDMVVILAPHYHSKPLVKRIIATGGEVVEVIDGGRVLVNGRELVEPYIRDAVYGCGDMDYPLAIPEGCVFVLGDNRNGSADSRLSTVGILKAEDIIGKVIFRIWPFDSFGGF